MKYLQRSCSYNWMILFCFACVKQKPREYQRYTFVVTNLQILSDILKNNGGKKSKKNSRLCYLRKKTHLPSHHSSFAQEDKLECFDETKKTKMWSVEQVQIYDHSKLHIIPSNPMAFLSYLETEVFFQLFSHIWSMFQSKQKQNTTA